MGRKFLLTAFLMLGVACMRASDIRITPVRLSPEEIVYLKKDLERKEKAYDPVYKMLYTQTKEKHYHSDLDSGVVVHQTRESLEYAVGLLKTEDEVYMQRGIDIIKTILPMQEKDPSLPYCGIWPYYPEDPLRGRKAAVDYNWADFIAVPLMEVIINHADYAGEALVREIKEALELAAYAIKKRDVQPDYTNICIMGTYVCYVVGEVCELPELTGYAKKRLKNFYEYTIRNKGFTEYNSPTYTPVAMDELLRMKQVIINPGDLQMIDELYTMAWDMIARHFHQPSGQWCGPNLRSYSNLTEEKVCRLLYNASEGQIELPGVYPRIPDVIKPHRIPADILPKFTDSFLPRLEIDTFVVADPDSRIQRIYEYDNRVISDFIPAKDIVGKLYATPVFALASVNQGYMWNQTRPLISHWGTQEHPSYMQVRFLHNGYDFSAMNIVCVQDSTSVLAILNVASDGGITHPNLDPIKEGKIEAEDLRLRIELGGELREVNVEVPAITGEGVRISTPWIKSRIEIPYARWDGLEGYWEKGGDGQNQWVDFVLYAGTNKCFDLYEIREAVIGLYVSMVAAEDKLPDTAIQAEKDNYYLSLTAAGLKVKALLKPEGELRVKNDYETESDGIALPKNTNYHVSGY